MSTTRLTRRRTSSLRSLRADEPTPARPEATGADRELLAPPSVSTTRRADVCPRRQLRWLPRMTRGRALAMLAVSLVILLGGPLSANAVAAPGAPVAEQPAPIPPLPLPIPTGPSSPVTCFPGSLQYECLNSSITASPTAPPCTGDGCIPQPTTSAPAPTNPGTGQSGDGDADCGITNISGCVTNAMNAFFRGIVTAALNPLLDLLSKTLLTTPTPNSLPRIGELWNNSWQILLASYVLLVLIAGILVMGYETVQTRYSIKEIAPRIVVGFLAGALSLWVATQAIAIANGLAEAVMGDGLDVNSAGETLKNLVLGPLNGEIFFPFMGIVLAGMLTLLLITYIVRVALTVILIAGAPIALMFHALPQTEGIAFWWWKAFGGCLAIQVGQSLALITVLKVFLSPGGFTLFGPTMSGLVNLLVVLALVYILFKIPFWVLSSVKGRGRSLVGSIVRGFIAYKTFGLLGGRGGGSGHRPRPSGGGRGGHGGGGRGPANPYARTRSTAGGQYVLPLAGVRRTRPATKPQPAPTPKPRTAQGRQVALPLGGDGPENKPVLQRDGQYRLPLDVKRVKPSAPPTSSGQPGAGGRQRGRPRSGQQPQLPFDPYKGIRATRSGQYPLPLEGLHRVRPAKPAPAPSPARLAPRAGQQLRLPLDLPKPPRRSAPLPPKPGSKP